MKFMFIVQSDGRGHMTQAIALSEMLQRNGHTVAEVLVGKSKSREIPVFFPEKINAAIHCFDTLSFIFKENKKHVHSLKTFVYNTRPDRLQKYKKSIELINHRIRKNNPDVVINFYEMLGSIANVRYNFKMPFINIGHQYLIKHHQYNFRKENKRDMTAFRLVNMLTSMKATKILALSFYPLDDGPSEKITVVPPLLRKEVLQLTPVEGDYILGYMVNQGYEEEVREWHNANMKTVLHLFWDKQNVPEEFIIDDTFTLHALDDEKFLNYMAGCKGYISTAGFESICEAMYLNKPVMMIPAHIEQEINAQDAMYAGAGIIGNNFNISNLLDHIEKHKPGNDSFRKWVDSAEEIILKQLTCYEEKLQLELA